jgi:uncharacterized glyoxalase superfamily protein PhnB
MSWKHEGYSSVSPYLIVRDAEIALAFLAAVFDVERAFERAKAAGGRAE